jgi:RNA polymerase sigma-70 factor (ECF subfamily)
LVQETLIAAIDEGRSFRGASSVRTWLVRILVNRAAMARRSKSRRHRHTEASAVARETTSTAGADAKLDLSAMLETLSPEHRDVIVLRELQGLSYEEIAAALGLPRGTVESRLHRAREALRKRFEGYLQQ